MNKVYGTMSVGMLITALTAWAVAGLAVTSDPTGAVAQIGADKYLTSLGAAIYTSPLKWVIMFAPLLFVFGFSAGINRMSAATAQTVFYAFAAVMGLSISSISRRWSSRDRTGCAAPRKTGIGGSLGCIANRTPLCSATGMTPSRNQCSRSHISSRECSPTLGSGGRSFVRA